MKIRWLVARAGTLGASVVRVSPRRLVPGRYRLTLRPVDAAGNDLPPARRTFAIHR